LWRNETSFPSQESNHNFSGPALLNLLTRLNTLFRPVSQKGTAGEILTARKSRGASSQSGNEHGATISKMYHLLKVKVRVKFTLEKATKAQRGSRGIALLFP
jgi:hypothetical protein